VIIETGVAHGGSLIFYASLLKGIGKRGRVIGIDIEMRPAKRKAIENHELSDYITLIEGGSAAPDIVEGAAKAIRPNDTVLVLLDSNASQFSTASSQQKRNASHDLLSGPVGKSSSGRVSP
jgi:cephalosporin hydroxylase